MKITAIKTVVVNAEMRNWIFVKVETDEAGLYGWGEATLEWKTRAVVGAVEDLAPLLIGRDPRDIEQAVRVMHKHGFWRMGVIGATAISGIEVALWDILGKELGVPVWRLLGGKTRDKVPVYTHLGLGDMRAVYETMQPGALVEAGLAVVEKGYRAVKVVFIPYTHYTTHIRQVDHVAKLMQALREAVGDGIEIMVDFHGRPASVNAALDYIRALEPGRPLFVEEPVPPTDPELMRAVTEQARDPIATGERLIGRVEFAPLFRLHALHIAQPDIAHTGGLPRRRQLAGPGRGARARGAAPPARDCAFPRSWAISSPASPRSTSTSPPRTSSSRRRCRGRCPGTTRSRQRRSGASTAPGRSRKGRASASRSTRRSPPPIPSSRRSSTPSTRSSRTAPWSTGS